MSLIGISLLLAATSAAAASPAMVNGKAQGVLDRGRNLLTSPALSKYRPKDYTTIESAHENNITKQGDLTGVDKFFSKLKIGHLLGTVLLPFLGLPKILDYFGVDSDSIWMKLSKIAIPFEVVGTAVSYAVATFAKNDFVESMKNLVDNFCQRLEVKKDRTITDVVTGADHSSKYKTSSDLILDTGNQLELKGLARAIKHTGAGRNLMGSTGIGKTSAVYALASGILEDNIFTTDGVQIWKANKNIMEGTLADVEELGFFTKLVDRVTGTLGLGKMTGETIAERLERLMANAVKHYKETGQPVIILLDEAHDLFGKGKKSSKSNGNNGIDINEIMSSISADSDPLSRSKTSEELGPLFEDKLKSSLCEGVMVVATSNGSREDVAYHLLRRMKVLLLKKPGPEQRKEMITRTLAKWYADKSSKADALKKDTPSVNDIVNLAFNDENKLQDIGTMNLLDFHFGGDEERARKEGYGSYIEALKKRNVLHYGAIEDAVGMAIDLYEGSGAKGFVSLLKQILEKALQDELNDKKNCLDDVRNYPEVDIERVQRASVVGAEEVPSDLEARVEKTVVRMVNRAFKPVQDFFVRTLTGSEQKRETPA